MAGALVFEDETQESLLCGGIFSKRRARRVTLRVMERMGEVMRKAGLEELDEFTRQAEQRPKQLFVLTVLIGLAVVLGVRHFGGEETVAVPASEVVQAVGVIDEPQVTFDLVEDVVDTSRRHEPASPPPPMPPPARPAGRTSYLQVYECTVNGQRVVADQPCAPDAAARVLEVGQPDPYEAARLASQQQRWGTSTGSSSLSDLTTDVK